MTRSLTLTINPEGWRLYTLRKADTAFRKFSEKVWQRDGYTCQFCGFQAKEHQEVINENGNYRNNKLSNLLTACCFCAQCLFLESVGRNENGGGTLIYFTDLTQNELNGLCHVLFCAITNATSYCDDAQNIYRSLKLRSQIVEKELGENLSDPATFGQMLIDSQIKEKQKKQQHIFNKLRLLPSRSKFSEQIETWAKAAIQEMDVNSDDI